jgi:hypothetical protein
MTEPEFIKFEYNIYIKIDNDDEYEEAILLPDEAIYITCGDGYYAPCFFFRDIIAEVPEDHIPYYNDEYIILIERVFNLTEMNILIINKYTLRIVEELEKKAKFFDKSTY